jgi:hypothetical protein
MVWHIFKKDVRLYWHFAAGVAVLGWLGLIVMIRADNGASSLQHASNLMSLIIMLQVAFSGILAAAVVQTDALPGVRQDWLVRPIERRDLLLAKLLFVVTLVEAPVFVGNVIEGLAAGMPASNALSASLLHGIWMLCAFYLPVMAFASITRNFADNIVTIVTTLAISAGLIQTIHMMVPTYWKSFGSTGVEWLTEFALLGIAIIGAAAILLVQYFRRRLLASRWMLAIFGLLCLAALFMPWKPAFAIQQGLSPHPGGASAVNLEFHPELGRFPDPFKNGGRGYRFVWLRREEASFLYLPLRILGLPDDAVLRTDMVTCRLTAPDGATEDLGFGSASPITRAPSASVMNQGLVMSTALFDKLKDKPVRLDLDYSLTLLGFDAAHAIPALDGQQTVPGFGRCETRMNKPATGVQLHCLMAPRTPPCVTFFLEHPSSGKRNPATPVCEGQYTPVYMVFEPDAYRRAIIGLPFRDTAGLMHMPVDENKIQQSQVVLRFYEPVEHFTRHVVIPDLRLADWLPL